MKTKLMTICLAVTVILAVSGMAQATPEWKTISFTGTDMFNYTTSVALRADQDAPRRLRNWDGAPDYDLISYLQSDGDVDLDGTNDFAEWASTDLSSYGFSYFNLSGYTSPPGGWGQKYQAVPDQDNGLFGTDSWRNQTVNGVAVTSGNGTTNTWWDGGIVKANQAWNPDNYAFPVWRAPVGTQLTMENAADYTFSVEVLMENPDTAYELDGTLRVFFGGSNFAQEYEGSSQTVAGIVLIPEPATVCLLGFGALSLLRRKRRA